MDCQNCSYPFDKSVHIPKILINCGHTLCSQCIQSQIDVQKKNSKTATESSCKCLECGTEFSGESAPTFPINIALLNLAKQVLIEPPQKLDKDIILEEQIPKRSRIISNFQSQNSQISLCDTHQKKIEAFCDLDKKILCIDCILNENHKSHEIISIEKACQKEKYLFEMSLKTALNKENEVQHQIFRVKNHLVELEEQANKNRTEISKIFNEIRQRIIEREAMLKKNISDILEKEQQYYKVKIMSLEEQLRSINELKDEKIRIEKEPQMETLIQAPYRFEIENEANKKIDNFTFRGVFQEIKKDEEIANIIKVIIPSHLKTSLLSGTVSSQIKKKEKQEEMKRRELSKQPHIPVYDYDKKFNYPHYLRDDKIPAFISTKQNQVNKKELDLEKIDNLPSSNESKNFISPQPQQLPSINKQASNAQNNIQQLQQQQTSQIQQQIQQQQYIQQSSKQTKNQLNNQLVSSNVAIGNSKNVNLQQKAQILTSNDNSPKQQQLQSQSSFVPIQQNSSQSQNKQQFQSNRNTMIPNNNQSIFKEQNSNNSLVNSNFKMGKKLFPATNKAAINLDTSNVNASKDESVNLTTRQSVLAGGGMLATGVKRSLSSGRPIDDSLQCQLPQSLKKTTPTKQNPSSGQLDNFEKCVQQQQQQNQQSQQKQISQKSQFLNSKEGGKNRKKVGGEKGKKSSNAVNNNSNLNLGNSINQSASQQYNKKKNKKQKQSQHQQFEFTNEKLFKQIVDSKKFQKSNTNQEKARKDVEESKRIEGDEEGISRFLNDTSQQNKQNMEERENRSLTDPHQSSNEFQEEDQEESSDQNIDDSDDMRENEEEVPFEEEACEKSSIHFSPQKRSNQPADQFRMNIIQQNKSPKSSPDFQGQIDSQSINKILTSSGNQEDKRFSKKLTHQKNIDSIGEKIEEEFNDDESRIPFQPEQYNFYEKSVLSIQFDLESNQVLNNEGKIPMYPNQMINNPLTNVYASDETKNQQSLSLYSNDYENLLKVKEEYIFVFSGFNEKFLNSVEVFDVTRGIWREFTNTCQNRTKFVAIQYNEDQILLIGGKDEYGIQTDEVDEFNIKDMKSFPGDWRLPLCLSGFSCCQIKKGIFAFCGGNDGQKIQNKFFIANFKNDQSTPQFCEMPPMIHPREEFQLIMGLDGKLYAIGGFNAIDGCISQIEAFDFEKQQWEVVTEMREGKRALNAVALPDGLYVLGGYNGKEYLNTVERYDYFSKKWSVMRSMNSCRGTFSSLVSPNCNYIYAIGGFNGQPIDHVERFDVIQNQWEYLAPLKQKRFMHAACLANIEKKK